MRQIPLGVRLPDRAVFASFLPARNAQALEHARRVAHGAAAADSPGCAGRRGSGKTHLLQAMCAAASERMRAGYVPLAEVAALGVGVLEGLPQLECLCLDDIDRVAGRAEWERAIFASAARDGRERRAADPRGTGAAGAGAAGRWRISARAVPRARCFSCACSMSRSSTRRCNCARALRGLELPDETWHWLQRRFPRDMRTLYELLDTLDEAALAAQRRLTVPFIREVLRSAARTARRLRAPHERERRGSARSGARELHRQRGDAPAERLRQRLLVHR